MLLPLLLQKYSISIFHTLKFFGIMRSERKYLKYNLEIFIFNSELSTENENAYIIHCNLLIISVIIPPNN